MTRETKIGMAVACSFLCLVGIVVASKWKRGDDPSEEQTVVVAANKPTEPGALEKKEPAKKSEAAANDKKAPGPLSLPMHVIPAQGNDAQIQQQLKDAKKSLANPPATIVIPQPASNDGPNFPALPAPKPLQFADNKQ